MASFNVVNQKTRLPKATTHEGGPAVVENDEFLLRRSVLTAMLGEDTFYEDGKSIMDRIEELSLKVAPEKVAQLAIECRNKFYLRHVPLLLITQLVKTEKGKALVRETAKEVIKRPDEIGETLAIYWRNRKDSKVKKLSKQLQKALGDAFNRFDEYQLGKYKGESKGITLKDAIRIVHPVPVSTEKSELFKKVVDETLSVPDTWETNMSALGQQYKGEELNEQKRQMWMRLMKEKKLGGLALIRNIRNMTNVGVSESEIVEAINKNPFNNVLPFRFLTSMSYSTLDIERALFEAMVRNVSNVEKLKGKTIVLLDNSGSMDVPISSKSEVKRTQVANALGVVSEQLCEQSVIYQYDTRLLRPNGNGFTLWKTMKQNSLGGGTSTGSCLKEALSSQENVKRVIIITDEQSSDRLPELPNGCIGFIINVAPYARGMSKGYDISYHMNDTERNGYIRINGFSDVVFEYIREYETLISNK
jgi:hypothetical protein